MGASRRQLFALAATAAASAPGDDLRRVSGGLAAPVASGFRAALAATLS